MHAEWSNVIPQHRSYIESLVSLLFPGGSQADAAQIAAAVHVELLDVLLGGNGSATVQQWLARRVSHKGAAQLQTRLEAMHSTLEVIFTCFSASPVNQKCAQPSVNATRSFSHFSSFWLSFALSISRS